MNTLDRTQTETPRDPPPKTPLPPLFDQPITIRNWPYHIHWPVALPQLIIPIIAIYGILTTPLITKTVVWSCLYGTFSMLGITAGYHRLWAHRSYRASPWVGWFLCCMGTAAAQHSILWWVKRHRAHHRWTDTDKDPYNAQRGLFYSHLGWLLIKRPKNNIGYIDMSDLEKDRIVMFQHYNYILLTLLMAFILPTCIAGFGWDDFKGGLYYGCFVRLTIVYHSTFCVNSLAHALGETPFDDYHTPRDHWLTALLTLGEGYHNFHHQFPQDYRNAIRHYQYDPTRWIIYSLSCFGLTSHLQQFPTQEIQKSELEMNYKRLKESYGPDLDRLPILSWQAFQTAVEVDHKCWVALDGVLYDLERFIMLHPGGSRILKDAIGKDRTDQFNGLVYSHSNAARRLLRTYRVAVLDEKKK